MRIKYLIPKIPARFSITKNVHIWSADMFKLQNAETIASHYQETWWVFFFDLEKKPLAKDKPIYLTEKVMRTAIASNHISQSRSSSESLLCMVSVGGTTSHRETANASNRIQKSSETLLLLSEWMCTTDNNRNIPSCSKLQHDHQKKLCLNVILSFQ